MGVGEGRQGFIYWVWTFRKQLTGEKLSFVIGNGVAFGTFPPLFWGDWEGKTNVDALFNYSQVSTHDAKRERETYPRTRDRTSARAACTSGPTPAPVSAP